MTSDQMLANRLIKALSAAKVPAFLASVESGSRAIRVHVCDSHLVNGLKERLTASITESGDAINVSVAVHNRAALANPRSLEHWMSNFRGEQILFDPTQVYARAAALVKVAREIERYLGNDVRGCFFDSTRRTLFVHLSRQSQDAAAMLAEKEQLLRSVIAGADGEADLAVDANIRIRFGLTMPVGSLVPVDRRAARQVGLRRTIANGKRLLALSSGFLLASSLAHAGTGRATSAEAAIEQFGVLGSLSVFRDGETTSAANAFAVVGLLRYFGDAQDAGETGPIVVAQGATGDSGPGLRIIVNPLKQIEDGPELNRPSWATPHTAGAGPGS